MQTPTPYEQREHQLCFFFIQLNRQVSSVRKKSQCAFYVVICLPAPRANETKVVFFLKKTKSALPFCLSLSTKPHDSPIKYSYWYTSLLILLSPPVLPVAFCAATLSSFRATTRNPGIPARYNSGHTSRASLLHLLPPPEAGPRIGVRVTHYIHSSLQREERTKKRRRCYRAISFGGWRRPRGCGTRCAQTVLALTPRSAGLLPAR